MPKLKNILTSVTVGIPMMAFILPTFLWVQLLKGRSKRIDAFIKNKALDELPQLYKVVLTMKLLDELVKIKSLISIDKRNRSIVGYIATKKFGRAQLGVILSGFSVGIYFVATRVLNISYSWFSIVFLIVIFALLVLHAVVLAYRIYFGFYGTNEFEMRELIHYVLEHSDDNIFSGSGPSKIFLDQRDYEFLREQAGNFKGVLNNG